MSPYAMLALAWTAWCALHSLLVSRPVADFLQERFSGIGRFYRIFYNLVAVVTLFPVWFYSAALRGPELFAWQGPLRIVQLLLLIGAAAFFVAGARRYDLKQFLGIRQLHMENSCSALTDDCRLDTRGVLALVRHPWYTGGILLIWARDLDRAGLVTNLVISGYFVLGAWLEERKLAALFGAEYADYRRQVSMFLPLKWIRRRLAR